MTEKEEERWPYDSPHTLDYNRVDPDVRDLCQTINKSSWLKTAESCAGHPRSLRPWSCSTYLRLVLYHPTLESYTDFLDVIEKFNEGKGKMWGDLDVRYGARHRFGVSFHVTFPEPKDEFERDLMINLFLRMFIEVDEMRKLVGKTNGV